ncbi:MAG: hypothetical protein LC102_03335 [Ignavibacteriales bacterium]|nr:MAG: hypothetical protein F9K26_07350 [Ignavibacteriaceae bacterium]MBW7872925.1 hypothetical protein [Ignavibacteria bacterium]MCZ2142446.1 hypothetical protein [Ignavibacteriales bacterium]OQY72949.1 MAG: hypothetical protein B6D45_08545 [Ignavibacteriales bacterium UTCHB3]MBV6445328.1 hypothetical protein [Ignavibacteriaceae bacterium]
MKTEKIKRVRLSAFLLFLFLIVGCENPFAPGHYTDPEGGSGVLSDLTTPDGVFINLKYAYTFKDTSIYSALIKDDFIFTFRDYDLGADVTWGREEELRTTYGLFSNSERLDLVWNNIVLSSGDSTKMNIVRSFNLTITFNPNDIIRINGRVNLDLQKNATTKRWQIARWIDESNL